MFTTAILLQLVDEGALRLDDALATHLPAELTKRLHVRRGVDRSGEITLRHLVTQTSGLPDHWADRRTDGPTLLDRVREQDQGWTLADAVTIVREHQSPRFAPGTPRKAHYSDTNFDLLGGVLEAVTGERYADLVATRIAEPLDLQTTYVFGHDTLDRFGAADAIWDGGRTLDVPLALAACQASGGIVSTASEQLRFLAAFLAGELFDKAHLAGAATPWNRIFAPFRYGTGVMRYAVPRLFSPVPPLVGHGGSTGTALFRCEDLGLDLALAVNQIRQPSRPYRLLMRLANEIRKG